MYIIYIKKYMLESSFCHQALRDQKARHETEMEPLSTKIDSLQAQLDEAMKARDAVQLG